MKRPTIGGELSTGSRGYSLVEVILTITIMGILTAYGMVKVYNKGNLESAAMKAMADIRYARNLAITTGVNHGVHFTGAGSYFIYRQNPSSPINDIITGEIMNEQFRKYYGVYIELTVDYEFDSWGKPVIGAGSTLNLRDTSGALRQIRVVANTGYVEQL